MSNEAMIDSLCRWFEREARDLPWRKRRSGYTALVSEAMLQQTQVSRVMERYKQFMRVFPNVRALARAGEQSVLAQWQGLGYYRRARNLHAAARMIVNDFGGRVPSTVHDLRRLPGVGRYTAGAIASIVFNRPEPIVDGNVERVLLRITATRCKPAETNAMAWKLAASHLTHASRPGVWNEALMELGATVCLPAPSVPRCDACPSSRWCESRKHGDQMRIPPAKPRPKPREEHHHAVVITHDVHGGFLVERRQTSGMWAGLWQVPTIEGAQPLKPVEVAGRVRLGSRSALAKRGDFVHKTTHRHIRFHVYTTNSRSCRGEWRTARELLELPMSSAQRRVFALLHNIGGVQEHKAQSTSRAQKRPIRRVSVSSCQALA